MSEFFRRAWANPTTTFSSIAAVAALLLSDLPTAPAWLVAALKVVGGLAAIVAGAAARDSGTPGAVSAAAAKPPIPPSHATKGPIP